MTAREHVSLLRYPGAARPGDPARRLEQDLCDDRLAPGLCGLAEAVWSRTPSGWRSTAIPASTPRRNRPASPRSTARRRAGRAMMRGLRRAPRVHRRGAEQAARRLAASIPAGAFYAFPNISGTGLDAKQLELKLLDEAGVATIAGTSFGAFGEGYLRVLLRQQPREDRRGDRAHPRISGQSAARDAA